MAGKMNDIMVFIIHDRAIDEEVNDMLQALAIKHYTKWKDTVGVGRHDPHLGDHTWPGLNNATMVVIGEDKKKELFDKARDLQTAFTSAGLRLFTVPVLDVL